jgi:hypothetical protein
MKSSSSNFVMRVALLLVLALGSVIAAETPAWARTFSVAFVGQSALRSACNGAGGYFSSNDSGSSYFCVGNGGAIQCTSYKHRICFGMSALTAPPKSVFGIRLAPASVAMGTRIPCDPFLCKIFCGGKPYCTFGTDSMQAIRP